MINAFLSVVLVNKNGQENLLNTIDSLFLQLEKITSQFELVVIDNCSSDGSIKILEELSENKKYRNIQIYVLAQQVDIQTASWAGVENALGDFVCVFDHDPNNENLMLDLFSEAINGFDYVYVKNSGDNKENISYKISRNFFRFIYRLINRRNIERNNPHFKVLSKNLINYILKHQEPIIKYKFLRSESIFSSKQLNYDLNTHSRERKNFYRGLDDGFQLLVSSTETPMRIVTSLSFLGAFFSIIYSLYVLYVSFTNENVADGWASLSLQFSLMFFLISCVLLILGEYILQMTRLSNEGPSYVISKEFTSKTMDIQETLNIESSDTELG
tara:strand:- start:627 stop:1613 length:987 start_codon:yes stop_codon:yes gene_type:complete